MSEMNKSTKIGQIIMRTIAMLLIPALGICYGVGCGGDDSPPPNVKFDSTCSVLIKYPADAPNKFYKIP